MPLLNTVAPLPFVVLWSTGSVGASFDLPNATADRVPVLGGRFTVRGRTA